jgi:hypothetical protein
MIGGAIDRVHASSATKEERTTPHQAAVTCGLREIERQLVGSFGCSNSL